MSNAAIFSSYGVGQYAGSAPTEGHLFRAPRLYRADGTKRGVLFQRGALSTAATSTADAFMPMVQNGYPTLLVDAASTTSAATWGNDASIARMTDSFNYLTGTWGAKTGKVGLVGASHGCITCLAWAIANPTKVQWIYLFLPANDVQDMHDNRSVGLATVGLTPTNIETAYGGLAAYNAAMPAHNPAKNATGLAGIPTRMVYSSDDPIVDVSTVTALSTVIGGVQLLNTGANGHSTGGVDDHVAGAAFIAANS